MIKSLRNNIAPGLSLERASMMPGKKETADNIPTINGASILMIVTFWKMNHDIAFSIVTTNPKKINKLKL